MPKLFFYSNIRIFDPTIGITKKVTNQISALREMGYEVYYSAYIKDGVAIFNNEDKVIYRRAYPSRSENFNRLTRRWILLDFVAKFIKKTDIRFKYSYLRFHFFDYFYLKMLKELRHKSNINIVEAHAYPYKTGKLSKRTPIHIIDSLYTPIARKYIDLVAGICDESNIWGVQTVNIDNAINLENISIQNKLPQKDETLRLFSVANETKFHRYDKIIWSLYDYYQKGGKRKIIINFVGEYLLETKNLIKKLGLEDNVKFYGKLFGSELDEIYNKSDIGIGAFSYRKNETTGSCIKTKEYFAKGLPFINGWKEPAFDDEYPYVKRFDTSKERIDIEEVIVFYDNIRKDKNVKYNMRKFASEKYTWHGQFKKVFEQLEIK